MGAVFEGATGDFNARKAGCIGLESANAAGKGDVLLIMDDIAKLDKVGTALLRDKKEMLASRERGEDGLDSRSPGHIAGLIRIPQPETNSTIVRNNCDCNCPHNCPPPKTSWKLFIEHRKRHLVEQQQHSHGLKKRKEQNAE